jgi:nitroreductase
MIQKPAQTATPIHELLARRWSGRAFKDAPISRAELYSLLEAAHWAPSCFNDQPWRFLVWDRNHDAGAWRRAFDCLDEGNRSWVKDAPILLLACADTEFSKRPGRANRWGMHDTGAASMNLHLQAVARGMMSHPMAGYDKPRIRAEFAIPERYGLCAMIAVGRPVDSADALGEKEGERELQPRVREPLGTRFFDGRWNEPVKNP